jgi:hypothetical protein
MSPRSRPEVQALLGHKDMSTTRCTQGGGGGLEDAAQAHPAREPSRRARKRCEERTGVTEPHRRADRAGRRTMVRTSLLAPVSLDRWFSGMGRHERLDGRLDLQGGAAAIEFGHELLREVPVDARHTFELLISPRSGQSLQEPASFETLEHRGDDTVGDA